MKTSISFTDYITSSMQDAGIEIGRIYTVSKVIWKNAAISEIHTHQHRFQVHGCIGSTPKGYLALWEIDWALEFEA